MNVVGVLTVKHLFYLLLPSLPKLKPQFLCHLLTQNSRLLLISMFKTMAMKFLSMVLRFQMMGNRSTMSPITTQSLLDTHSV